jgi:hypothetical protein
MKWGDDKAAMNLVEQLLDEVCAVLDPHASTTAGILGAKAAWLFHVLDGLRKGDLDPQRLATTVGLISDYRRARG